MNIQPQIPSWLRHTRAAQQQPLQEAALTLSEKIHPFLEECDRALAENARLRGDNSHLREELRVSNSMQLALADRVDTLEGQLAVAQKEAALLRARMKMFGEAATIIVDEATKEAEAAFVPKNREEFLPTAEEPVRPVKSRAAAEAESDEVASIAFLARTPLYQQ